MGIDVYNGDGCINWQMVAKDHKFGICKATTRAGGVDTRLHTNMAGMAAAGLVRGAYHWLNMDDPVGQAQNFLRHLHDVQYGGWTAGNPRFAWSTDMPPAVDVEDADLLTISNADLVGHVSRFLEVVEGETGRKCLFYVNRSFADEHLGDAFGGHPLWCAEYSGADAPVLPSGWKEWRIWQYSEHGTVDGVPNSGETDLNRFNGSLEDLRAWIASGV